MKVDRILNTPLGKYFISIILGLGLATLFRKSCENDNCIVFKAPNINKLTGKPYKFNGDCYNYNFNSASCDSKKRIVSF